ncbi:MAG: cytochrome c biogenesis protein CcdA, partial [Nocardiopsaceae bacterium]|nr:cytochrome c biogenesis protein CcdA [Nocardiopsaceae bacterium]
MSVGSLVSSGPLLLAIPVAAAAGAVTFLSPCVLPLVPGYLSYITGMSGAAATTDRRDETADETAVANASDAGTTASGTTASGAAGDVAMGSSGGGAATAVAAVPARRALPAANRGRALAGASLFVLGFSALFAVYGAALGSLGAALHEHSQGLSQILGVVLILLGLLFAGAFERLSFTGRIIKPSVRPRGGRGPPP